MAMSPVAVLEDPPEGVSWKFPRKPVSREERKKLFGKVIEVAVLTTFRNHIYMYRNDLYKQKRGGAIGLRLTGVVARLVMDRWARIFLGHLSAGEVEVYMLKKYVDDINLVMAILERGWHWEKGMDKS